MEFYRVRLDDVRVRAAEFRNVRMSGVELVDVEIDAELRNVVVNGVDIAPLVEAELNRRMPERAAMRPDTVEGFRTAWAILERLWAGTIAPASVGHVSDRAARPTLDEVLAIRSIRGASIERVLAGLTAEQLASTVTRTDPGWPQLTDFAFAECLRVVLNEEWEHRLFAERDLTVLEKEN